MNLNNKVYVYCCKFSLTIIKTGEKVVIFDSFSICLLRGLIIIQYLI